jgi:hypothetical protein
MSSLIAKNLTEARLQLHYAIQLIAATGVALAAPQPDYSHASLDWDAASRLFVGATISADRPFQVAIDPVSLTVFLLDPAGAKLAEYSLPHKTMSDGLTWLKRAIAELGADADQIRFLSYPPDDFPDHAIAHGAPFEADPAETRAALTENYATTYELLQELVATTAGASPVHIWPHHFDMATLISLPSSQSHSDQEVSTIGIGFSPGDKSYNEPYWYVSPYPYPDLVNLPQLEGHGFWHTTDWVGAVLTASRLQQHTAKTAQIRSFLQSALKASQTLLSG